jgi:hypothetical protein
MWSVKIKRRKKNYPDIPAEARCYLTPGKNQEGYWTIEHLLELETTDRCNYIKDA